MSKRKSFSQNMNLRAKELSSTEKEYIEKQEARKFKEKRTTVFSKEMIDTFSEYALSQRIEQEEMNLRAVEEGRRIRQNLEQMQRNLQEQPSRGAWYREEDNLMAPPTGISSVPVLFKVGDLVRHTDYKIEGIVVVPGTGQVDIKVTACESTFAGSAKQLFSVGSDCCDEPLKWRLIQPGYALELEKKRLAEKEILKDPVKRLSRMRHSGILNKDKE